MIVDNIKNASKYYGLGEGFKKALEYMAANMDSISESVVLDEQVKINYSSYTTKEQSECIFESHIKYADIHLAIKGGEQIGYAITDSLSVSEVDEENDCLILKGEGINVPLEVGTFMIMLPQDAHMVGICKEKPDECTKLIAKIKL